MKKRNLAAMGLAGVMAVSMCMPVMAADEVVNKWDNSVEGEKEITVTRSIPTTYTVTIPSNVAYTDDSKTFSIDATNLKLEANHVIKVSANGTGVEMKAELDPAKVFEMSLSTDGGTNPVSDGVLATFNGDNATGSQEITLMEASENAITRSGDYKGTLKFTIAYESVTPAPAS